MNTINPSYYVQSDGKQTIDHIEEMIGVTGAICFCLGNSIKYIERAGRKKDNPSKQDIEKSKWYLNKARVYSNKNNFILRDKLEAVEKMYRKVVKQ